MVTKKYLFMTIVIAACNGEEKISSPTSSNNNSSNSNAEGSSDNQIACPEQWQQESSGAWIDPVSCAAWSPVSDSLTWHETVSSAEASNSGCNSNCDQAPNVNYCQSLDLGGYSWETPSLDDLEALAEGGILPFNELDVELWTATSDSQDTLALIINLAQPGMIVSIQKTDQAKVRCMAK